jgi:HEAT repeat protein
MEVAERIEAIINQCHNAGSEFKPLLTAARQYLSGNGPLSAVQQAWQALIQAYTYYYSQSGLIYIADPRSERLDDFDLLVLDVSMITGTLSTFFSKIAEAGPVEQARDYLRAKGMDEPSIIESLVRNSQFYDDAGNPTALGQLVLSYVPEHSEEILRSFPTGNWGGPRRSLFRLCLLSQPEGYLDLAWQLAKTANLRETDEYAAELLKVDAARFTDWARQVARDTMQVTYYYGSYAYPTLKALLELDPAQNIDLAVEAFGAPLKSNRYVTAELQRIGLEAAYRFDPVTYLPFMEEAAASRNVSLRQHAINVLKKTDFEQARPILQRCVASYSHDVALLALNALLDHEWPERQDYLLSLLSHRAKPIRETSAKGLAKAGESVIEALAPSLAHTNAEVRLAAVQALQLIGGEQARAALVARLDVEKSLKIKQAILDVVGAAAVIASSETAPASPAEALSAEAEAVFKRVKKPVLPWFDAAQMPGLRWNDGEPVQQAVVNYLIYLQSRVKQMEPAERVQQALPLIDRSSSGDLALALFNGWLEQHAPSKQAWILPLVCALADERLIPLMRRYIDGWTGNLRGTMAGKAVTAMVHIESNLALEEINDIRANNTSVNVRWTARKVLNAAAEQRGITLDELDDLVVPKLGFDERGQRVFDYGPRQFTVRLYFDQTIQITDHASKRLTTLPKPAARDDASKAKAAHAAWSLLKNQVPQVMKTQAQRLERALNLHRSWDVARWQTLFLKHPVLRPLAVTLVWGVVAAESSGYQTIFRPLEDGSLTDVEDNAIELPTEGRICLVDPAELDETIRSACLQHLTDYEVMPPFAQLNRPVARVPS